MNFARYLYENRGEVLDLRPVPDDAAVRAAPEPDDPVALATPRKRGRVMLLRTVRPAFAPSFHAPRLPFIEPSERR